MVRKQRTAAMAFAVACSTAAQANTDHSAGFAISANVPEVCQLESSVLPVDVLNQTARGTVFEMCNSSRGFRVIASYRPLGDGEEVEFDYGGDIQELDSSGMSDVAQRGGPSVRNVPVAIRANGLAQNLAISLGIAAI